MDEHANSLKRLRQLQQVADLAESFRLGQSAKSSPNRANPLARKAAARCECVLGLPASCVAKWIQRAPREPPLSPGIWPAGRQVLSSALGRRICGLQSRYSSLLCPMRPASASTGGLMDGLARMSVFARLAFCSPSADRSASPVAVCAG